jgi:hypothetical protein
MTLLDNPTAAEITALAAELRQRAIDRPVTPQQVIDVFDAWSAALPKAAAGIPGAVFLTLWLRRATLVPMVARELGDAASDWQAIPGGRLKAFPVGVVGHWPAANVDVGALLSMTCGLLGGNAALVRVPSGSREATLGLLNVLRSVDPTGLVASRIGLVAFPHERHELLSAMAAGVDGAMIWGGREAVTAVRGLPFPSWARLAVFGPRVSVAAIDRASWSKPDRCESWCKRLARDVWPFEQMACSSPQVLFVEADSATDAEPLVRTIEAAFVRENRLHPRTELSATQAAAIARARASWLLNDVGRSAVFPIVPDWTILVGSGTEMPEPVQSRTLSVLVVPKLEDAIGRFDGHVQTLGLAVGDAVREQLLAELAGRRGVDRIVPVGRMHLFESPWDGMELIAPMVRWVRHAPAAGPEETTRE